MDKNLVDKIKNEINNFSQRIKENLNKIEKIEKEIQFLLKNRNLAEDSGKLRELYRENNELLKLNSMYLEIKNTLLNCYLKLNQLICTELAGQEKTYTKEEYFEMTVSNEIAFDEHHPLYSDEVFKEALMEYYLKNEEYEKCAEIQKSGKYTDDGVESL